jgi:hypothetical protein
MLLRYGGLSRGAFQALQFQVVGLGGEKRERDMGNWPCLSQLVHRWAKGPGDSIRKEIRVRPKFSVIQNFDLTLPSDVTPSFFPVNTQWSGHQNRMAGES